MPIHGKTIEYEKPPMGLNAAVIAGVYDIGTHKFEWKGETSENPQIVLAIQLEEEQTKGDHAGQPFVIYKFASLYMSKNAKLRKDVNAILGRVLSDGEAKAFDLESLVGTNCYVTLIEDGDKYKVDSFSAANKRSPVLKPLLEKEPEFITKKRAESLEAKNGVQAPAGSAPPHGDDDLPF